MTDSRAGRRFTWIFGRLSAGIYRAQKNVTSHAKIGDAGQTNCPVIGSIQAVAHVATIKYLRIEFIIYNE
jgi:hypothetical protein